jgi:hypothetical protein
MLEELGVEVGSLELLGVLENMFVHEEQRGHEIVFVIEASFDDRTLYDFRKIVGSRARWTSPLTWVQTRRFATEGRLGPEGLYDPLMERS